MPVLQAWARSRKYRTDPLAEQALHASYIGLQGTSILLDQDEMLRRYGEHEVRTEPSPDFQVAALGTVNAEQLRAAEGR